VKLLDDKGVLLRNFTQNIDTLERVAGVSGERLVEAHGSFSLAHCVKCRQEYTCDFVKEYVFRDEIPLCTQSGCPGTVKPDIVFFGENLPKRYFELSDTDFKQCDLLFVIGTSLQVQPFASLIHKVSEKTPRVLINNEVVGERKGGGGGGAFNIMDLLMGMSSNKGFVFEGADAYRDIKVIGDCQASIRTLAQLLGWSAELDALVAAPLPSL